MCIWAYTRTSPTIASHVNDVLLSQQEKEIINWDSYIYTLCHGLELLPLYWGKVYRVTSATWATKQDWKVGETVKWFPFTNGYKNKHTALEYSYGEPYIYFEITSWTGRDISKFSTVPQEEEFLFRCGTDFYVSEVYDWDNKQKRVILEEVTNINPGFDKILLWVDDNPKNNNAMLAKCEALKINIIIRKTTESALAFLKSCPHDFFNRMKIVSDMGRFENERLVENAGAIFLDELVKFTGLNWEDRFIFYVGSNAKSFLPDLLQHTRVHSDDGDVRDFLGLHGVM